MLSRRRKTCWFYEADGTIQLLLGSSSWSFRTLMTFFKLSRITQALCHLMKMRRLIKVPCMFVNAAAHAKSNLHVTLVKANSA